MSSYHEDKKGCTNCLQTGQYKNLSNLTNYSCDQTCSCRFTNERSTRDMMNFNYYVLGKPMNLQPQIQPKEKY